MSGGGGTKQKQIIDSEVFCDIDFLCVLEFLKFQNTQMYYCTLYFLVCSDSKVTVNFLKFS